MTFSTEEQKQYSRHLILEEIGVSGQEQLKKAKVLIVGAGGLGCPVLQYLAAAGVGTLAVIDPDRIEQSNLQRQILYTHENIGKFKATVAIQKLAKLNPYITLKDYVVALHKNNAVELFEQYDIIVDGSDNFATRYLVNDAAVITKKPVVFGSIFKFEGQVSVYNYQGSATYRCLYPNMPDADAVPNCSTIGVVGVLPGIIGSLQANEVIKMICGVGEVLINKLLVYNTLTMQQYILTYSKSKEANRAVLEEVYEIICGIEDTHIEIGAEELQKNRSQYTVLDVRTREEHNNFNIGGEHIPLDELSGQVQTLSGLKPIVVCCHSGIRSKKAISILQKYRDDLKLINLKEGLQTLI
ncbi:molybdopterin-synthase adenylyltransferase MoeB [Aquimarina rhabdastrellae]